MNGQQLHGSSKEIHNNMLRIVAGHSLDEKVPRANPEGIAKLEKSWWFDFSVLKESFMGVCKFVKILPGKC